MLERSNLILATLALVGLTVGGAVYATTGGGDDDETELPITGEALVKATAAALAHTGGGKVSGTEVGDEDSYYEVEVTLDDGTQVDVQLDEDFQVVHSERDEEHGDD